jgi:hypothetical protein
MEIYKKKEEEEERVREIGDGEKKGWTRRFLVISASWVQRLFQMNFW